MTTGYDDEGPPDPGQFPDHHWSPGCCDVDRHFHQWSEAEAREQAEWMATEPGLLHRLQLRRDQLDRLLDLGAPAIILENQRRMIREIEQELER